MCRQKQIELVAGEAMPDHVHMPLRVPPRYSIAVTVGYLKGKSAIRIHRDLSRVKGTLFGRSFWARGYCASPYTFPMIVAVEVNDSAYYVVNYPFERFYYVEAI